ncbi:myeloid-derived growth factor isoform X2 [Myotis myotis]|uniref:myeloid-derived growth factor isoform X2 n=1 Tax=Myotis myotis TaxID=51298 RepID=UPI001747F8AB|nr:myeloid-derived growth factor isoform X2 [Myotis myotis]
MAAPSRRRNGGDGASLWAALLLAAVALRPAEAVSEPTTVAFDVRPGGVVHTFSQSVGPGDKYTCVFTYASQGGTNEKWQMSLGTSEDHQHFTCTIWRLPRCQHPPPEWDICGQGPESSPGKRTDTEAKRRLWGLRNCSPGSSHSTRERGQAPQMLTCHCHPPSYSWSWAPPPCQGLMSCSPFWLPHCWCPLEGVDVAVAPMQYLDIVGSR